MLKNKARTLMVASVMIMLCVGMAIGGTYALFTDKVEVENHLVAGNLNITLERTKLVKNTLNNNGYLQKTEVTTVKDFSNDTNSNVFDIGSNEFLVPASYYEATMRVSNNSSIAFEYDIVIRLTSASNKLAEQMNVYIDGVKKGTLSEFTASSQLANIGSGTVVPGNSREFIVKIEFASNSGNITQGQSVKFDLAVEATQKTN